MTVMQIHAFCRTFPLRYFVTYPKYGKRNEIIGAPCPNLNSRIVRHHIAVCVVTWGGLFSTMDPGD